MTQDEATELIIALAGYSDDPVGFVYFAFPWGVPGSELEDHAGPFDWQIEVLRELGAGLITIDEAIRIARTSGHGIGKSALVSWIILWAISTFEDTKGVVTANTENQLKTKTWAEVAKWHRMFIARELFELSATALYSRDPLHERTWRIDMVPWSERNTEAFAGLHNSRKRILVIMDEASAIPDVIWEVTEGALTDRNTQIIWCVFGNPTRNKGRFRECFSGGKFSHRWKHAAIDSRDVPGTNKKQFDEWVTDFGLDSDFVRVRVRGIFPRADAISFIPFEDARQAVERELPEFEFGPSGFAVNPAPIVLGVDVARFGDDATVIYPRQGRDARSRPPKILRGMDLMRQASIIAQMFNDLHASTVMIDAGGVGGGLVDRLRQLRIPVWEVDFGSNPDGINVDISTRYYNKRAEIWGAMRDWIKDGCIINEIEGQEATLVDELTAPTYGFAGDDMEIQLEKKKDMRRRGVPSPNVADALACTFAYNVYMPKLAAYGIEDAQKPTVMPDYNPFAKEYMQ